MTQLIQGITIKPYAANKEEEKSVSFSIGFSTEKLKVPFRLIRNLCGKSLLNDFGGIFRAPVE